MKVIVNFYVKKRSEKESKYCACTKMDSRVSALEKAPTIHLTVDDFSSKHDFLYFKIFDLYNLNNICVFVLKLLNLLLWGRYKVSEKWNLLIVCNRNTHGFSIYSWAFVEPIVTSWFNYRALYIAAVNRTYTTRLHYPITMKSSN